VAPTILGRLHGIKTAGIASFELLVSPPSLRSIALAVGCYNHRSKTPSGTRAQVEAFVDRS
jgi:hypothetical protein